jgi:excisionase family DNA binding protein
MSNAAYLTPTQISHRWSFHSESVRRMIRQGRLPAVRIGGRLLVAQGAIETFESANRAAAPRNGGQIAARREGEV